MSSIPYDGILEGVEMARHCPVLNLNPDSGWAGFHCSRSKRKAGLRKLVVQASANPTD